MPASERSRLTNSSDETAIDKFFGGNAIFRIPYFQRAYKWKKPQLKRLEEDINKVIDEQDIHFLGAIIIHSRQHVPAGPGIFDVIDGQQRLMTLFLYFAALAKTYCDDFNDIEHAEDILGKHLVVSRVRDGSNIKLQPCKEDRTQLNDVFRDLMTNRELANTLGKKGIKYLPAGGSERGTVKNNYRAACRFMREQVKQGGVNRIDDVLKAMIWSLSIVQIDVKDPTNGPGIFSSLNSTQEPMTVGDLVRNEIFSRVAKEDEETIDQIDREKWQPFYDQFKFGNKEPSDLFDQYFFPYGLIHDHNLKKSEVYNGLREKWKSEEKEPGKIIEELSVYQNAFIDVVCGTNLQEHSKKIAKLFRNLYDAKAPGSANPFLMQISNTLKDKTLSEDEGAEVLVVLESFFVRRAVCGQEPTGLHAIFKRLWADCGGKPTRDSVIKQLREPTTVQWPEDKEFRDNIQYRSLYGAGITEYLIIEYDKSLGGDHHEGDDSPWIEHVLPEKLNSAWVKFFTKAQHEEQKDRLANLIPLSPRMNRSLSNKAFKEKRKEFEKNSKYKSAREFPDSYKEWTPEALKQRAKQLAKWAVQRWKY